jgi:hypothetical protein
MVMLRCDCLGGLDTLLNLVTATRIVETLFSSELSIMVLM